ncbi:MAG: ABC transporter substrate-binding protein [Xanthobacteraceae bacterium]
MRSFRLCIAAISASILLGVGVGVGTGAAERPITIGAMYNLTGGQRDLDIPSSEGARLAVAEANAGGGLLSRPVKLRLVDGETNPGIIAAKAAALFSEVPDTAGLIGFSDTDMVLAAAPIAAKHRRVFLTSGATSPQLPEQVPVYLFLACFGDNVQAAAGAEWAYDKLRARTVAVIYKETSSYARLLHRYFEERFKELGGRVLAVLPYQLDHIREQIDKLPNADLIYLAAQPDDVARAIPALRNAGLETPILGGDGLDIGEAWREVKDARHVYFTTHAYISADNPDPRVKAFREAFAKAYPGRQPDAFAALGYDTARLLMAAIGAAGRTEPEAVRKALAGTHDFEGVTGTISYQDGSRIPSKSVAIIAIEQGAQKYMGSLTPKKIPVP